MREEFKSGTIIKVATHRRLYRDERAILEFLGGGGFMTGKISIYLHGNADARRRSQWTRQTLLAMQREGWVELMDTVKPVVWRRTAAGTEALISPDG